MNNPTYSTYEAKARFSEILRQVRAGNSVFITHRGLEVAEIRPIETQESADERIERLERSGVLSSGSRELSQGGTHRRDLLRVAEQLDGGRGDSIGTRVVLEQLRCHLPPEDQVHHPGVLDVDQKASQEIADRADPVDDDERSA